MQFRSEMTGRAAAYVDDAGADDRRCAAVMQRTAMTRGQINAVIMKSLVDRGMSDVHIAAHCRTDWKSVAALRESFCL